jgi:SAM-dependent methyltransferase
MGEAAIASFWESHPCGDGLVGGLGERFRGDYEEFFTKYDEHKYRLESHIPRCIADLDVQGKRVLEIGLGEGAESELLIRSGAEWSGIDLTSESVDRVRTRLELRGLPYQRIVQGSVLELPFGTAEFDLVFSHGVLHHVPDIVSAQRQIRRVVADRGELVAMLYARRSLNYLVAIAILRRAAVVAGYPLRKWIRGNLFGEHLVNAEKAGLVRYLNMRNFVHRNTDGPRNPYSKVYDARGIERDFPDFEVTRMHKHFMHAPPLPLHGLPGERLLGWHLWVHLRPRRRTAKGQAALSGASARSAAGGSPDARARDI